MNNSDFQRSISRLGLGLILLIQLLPSAVFSQDTTVSQIIATYKANQARFHAQHKGTVLSGTGLVVSIKTDFLGIGSRFYVRLDVNGSEISCSTKDQTSAASFDKGQRINFRGTVDDVILGSLFLDACKLSAFTSAPKTGQNVPQTKPQGQLPVDETMYRNHEPIICKTDRQIIVIDETKPNVDRYRTWNFPKTREDIPNVSLVNSNSVKLEGTGVCRHRVAKFKTGTVEYIFTELGCYGEVTPPENTVGEIVVYIDNIEKMRKWCIKNGT
jgi:hypothetical protein